MKTLYPLRLVVFDPITRRPLPEIAHREGHRVDRIDTYWARRIADGDVSETPPEPPADEPAPKPTKRGR